MDRSGKEYDEGVGCGKVCYVSVERETLKRPPPRARQARGGVGLRQGWFRAQKGSRRSPSTRGTGMAAGDGVTSTVGAVGMAGIEAGGVSMRTWAGFLSGVFGSGIFLGGAIGSVFTGGAATGALPQLLPVLQLSQPQSLRRKPSRSRSKKAWLPQPHELLQVSHVLGAGAHVVQAGSWQRLCQVQAFGQLSQVEQVGAGAGLQVSQVSQHLRANRPRNLSRSLWPKLSQPQASWHEPQPAPQPVETTGAGATAAGGAGFLSAPPG